MTEEQCLLSDKDYSDDMQQCHSQNTAPAPQHNDQLEGDSLLRVEGVQHMIVLGLGTLDNVNPRHQLALAILLRERLPALQVSHMAS